MKKKRKQSLSRQHAFSDVYDTLGAVDGISEGIFVGALHALAQWAEDEGILENSDVWFNKGLKSSKIDDVEDENEEDDESDETWNDAPSEEDDEDDEEDEEDK